MEFLVEIKDNALWPRYRKGEFAHVSNTAPVVEGEDVFVVTLDGRMRLLIAHTRADVPIGSECLAVVGRVQCRNLIARLGCRVNAMAAH